MAFERDLFAGFERMRREMDELLGEGGARLGRRAAGFAPAVDVYYCGDPPRAVVKADLAGIEADSLGLEIQGRELTLTGHRRSSTETGEHERVYQQIEIPHGTFRRVVALGADVDADAAEAIYEDGILRVELPLVRPEASRRSVPIARGRIRGGGG